MFTEGKIFTLEDLRQWSLPGTWLAVLGDPIGHSLSPILHNAALAAMSEKNEQLKHWRYVAFHLATADLKEALPLFHQKGFKGINLTIPHKVDAVKLVHSIEAEVEGFGAVNTLIRSETGYTGTNTDGYGISKALGSELGLCFADKEVILCGAGGASRAIAMQALTEGCPKLWLGNRSEGRLNELRAILAQEGWGADRVEPFFFNALPADLPRNALVINATSAGLKAGDEPPLDLSRMVDGTCLYDTTYGCRNGWRRIALERDWPYADGLSMLVWQGARSLEYWTGCEVPIEVMMSVARKTLRARMEVADD